MLREMHYINITITAYIPHVSDVADTIKSQNIKVNIKVHTTSD